jgi:glycosyltransferase involved in cell wall biosynthesis
MRICVVSDTYWPDINGVAMSIHQWFSGLAALGHDVQLVTTPNRDRTRMHVGYTCIYRTISAVSVLGYREVKIGMPSNQVLRELWRAQPPDIVYVATEGMLGWFAIKLAHQLQLPVVSGFHTNFQSYSQFYKLGFLQSLIERYLRALHNRTVCTIVPTVEQLTRVMEMGINSVAVVGRGVDTSMFRPSMRSEALRHSWGCKAQDPVIVYVGRIAEEKNLDLTLATYTAMRDLNPRLKLVMVGDGPAVKRIQFAYPEVIFAGIQTGDDLAAHYASGDIFLLSSVTETFGNVVLEALASGLAVVSYRYAAGRLHITHNQTGLLVPFGDEQSFIQQSTRLVTESGLSRELGAAAFDYALTLSWAATVKRLEGLFEIYCDESADRSLDNDLKEQFHEPTAASKVKLSVASSR